MITRQIGFVIRKPTVMNAVEFSKLIEWDSTNTIFHGEFLFEEDGEWKDAVPIGAVAINRGSAVYLRDYGRG